MKKAGRAIGWMFVLGTAVAAAPLGTAVTYQGQLKLNGIPASGSYDFSFRLWDAVSGGAPTTGGVGKLNVPVENGLFSVEIDFGNSAFTGSALWLEVGVRPGGSPPLTLYTRLTPRQPLNVAPYAIFALSGAGGGGFTIPYAGTQPSGSQTTFSLTQAGTGGTAKFESTNAANSSNVMEIVTNGTGNAVSGSTTGTGRAGYFTASNAGSTSNAVEIRHDSGNSGSRGLYVLHSGYGDAGFFESTDAATAGDAVKARVNGAGQAIDALTTGFSNCGVFVVDHPGGSGDSVQTSNNGIGDGIQSVATSNGRAGYFQVNNASNAKNAVEIETNGNSTSRGLSVLHTGLGDNGYFAIQNAASAGEAIEARTSGTGNAVQGITTGSGRAGYFEADGTLNSGRGIETRSNGGGDAFQAYSTGIARAGFFQTTSSATAANTVEILTNGGNSNRAMKLTHTGTGDGGHFEISNAASGGEALEARHNGSGDAVQAVHTGTGRAGYFQISNAASTNTALYCTSNGTGLAFHANGTARVNVLEILGGSDLSEGFDVAGEQVEPGMVVTIDPKNPGRLQVAAQAYDTKVAGIVAGAGGVKPGMIMKQEGSAADGKHPVALTGRVYSMADATQAAIEPGDLLVSSDTPGHAMKSADRERAHGAIIGKAMTALPQGEKGLVLVLVSLQ